MVNAKDVLRSDRKAGSIMLDRNVSNRGECSAEVDGNDQTIALWLKSGFVLRGLMYGLVVQISEAVRNQRLSILHVNITCVFVQLGSLEPAVSILKHNEIGSE